MKTFSNDQLDPAVAQPTRVRLPLAKLVDYLYDHEKLHFEQCGSDEAQGHIFHAVCCLREWLEKTPPADAAGTKLRKRHCFSRCDIGKSGSDTGFLGRCEDGQHLRGNLRGGGHPCSERDDIRTTSFLEG